MASRKPSAGKKLEAVLIEIVFAPDAAQRQAKAAFWVSLREAPLADPDSITLALALDVVRDTRLNKWWRIPGFKEWFANNDEWRQRIEYLTALALDSAEDILLDPNPKSAGAKVRLIEVLARLANKEPARAKEVKYLDKAVQDMDVNQLEAFLEKNGLKVLPGRVADEEASVEDSRGGGDSGTSVSGGEGSTKKE